MKKHIVFILLLLFTIPVFSQQRGNIFNVPHWNTAFGITLPKNTFVYCSDSNKVYRLKVLSTSIGSLLTVLNEEYPNRSTLPLYWDSINNVIFPYDTANAVAIGTNAVASGTMLRVNNGSVLFDGTTGTTPASGAGTRMMWIPSKAAFRAGAVTDYWWNDAYIGNYSVAFGEGNLVDSYGLSQGLKNQVNGAYGIVFGYYNVGNGARTSILGGALNTANGAYSVVLNGLSNTTTGEYSGCGGQYSTSGSYNEFVFGRYNIVAGTSGSWVATDGLFRLGNGTGTGANSNDALRILKNGTAYIGDASSTTDPILTVSTTDSTTSIIGTVVAGDTNNGVIISPDGLRLRGSATVYEDLRIDALATPVTADEPALTSGFGGAPTVYQRMFQGTARDDKIYFNVQLPHAWKEGGEFEIHIHTAPWTTPVATDTVVWELQWNWQNIDDTFGTPKMRLIKQPLSGVAQWQHKLVELADFESSNKTISSVMYGVLTRKAVSNASDTYTGGMTVLYIDCHYEVDALGSGSELVK